METLILPSNKKSDEIEVSSLFLIRLKNGEGGIRTLGTELPAVHRISNPALSTTQPPLQAVTNTNSSGYCEESQILFLVISH
jgi:hypothetical protein